MINNIKPPRQRNPAHPKRSPSNATAPATSIAKHLLATLLLLLTLPLPTHAQHSSTDTLTTFRLADPTLHIDLIAAEPLVESPCAIAFDEKGHLFVAENRGYPNTAEPPQGRIAMLTDTDGDGRMDTRTTFADGLTFPNGVLPWRDGLIVTCAPDVLFLKDTDGDGCADERHILFTGFDTAGSTQLRVNAPTLGPDGWIYLAAGLRGGAITCPAHPDRPPLKMTADVRFRPDTLEIENVDGRSQYGMSFDDAGHRFICMNRIQVQHVVLPSQWLRRNPATGFTETVQNCPELVPNGLMHATAGAARLFPISANITTADSHQGFFSAACAVTIWRAGGSLPDQYRGCAFSCDPTGNLVHVDRMIPHGLTFAAVSMFENREFLASSDDWFRPVFLTRGPDGALYIADMTRKVIEHPDYLPGEVRKRTDFETGKAMGRIWRVKAPAAHTAAPGQKSAGETLLQRVMRDSKVASAESLHDLATLLAKNRDDRWMRAAVLSGIANHEIEFLRALFSTTGEVDEAMQDIFVTMGRMFSNVAALEKALKTADASAPTSPEETRRALTALVVGAAERANERIDAAADDVWLNAIVSRAIECAQDAAASTSYRQLATRLLARLPWSKAHEPLSLLAASDKDETLQSAAIRALASFPEPEVCRTLLAPGKWSTRTPAQRETILGALLANPAHLGGVLDAIEAGALPQNAIPTIRRSAFLKAKDTTMRTRAEKLFVSPAGNQQAAFEKAKGALALTGDAAHGREIFHNFCSSCHRLEQDGHAVGPDLFDIRNQPKENILFHIVAPDAEIAPTFTAYSVEMKDGRIFAGLLASETTSSLKLRMPLAQEESLSRSDVSKMEALPSSLMPSGLDAMGNQALSDLLAFLKGEGKQ